MIKWINLVLLIAVVATTSCSKHDDPNAQLLKEIKEIDAYLASVNAVNVAYDAGGNRLVITRFGDGAPPHLGQTVKAQFTAELFSDGTLIDAGVIDKKLEDIEPAGLRRGIASMPKGTATILYVPSDYAYGSKGTDVVPPNATIVYKIILDDVIRTADEQAQFAIDTAAIHKYIKDEKILNVTQHPSGIWYSITSSGTGSHPKFYEAVTFDYKGTLISNKAVFDQGTLTDFNIFNSVDGFKIGMPLFGEGGAGTLYIPSLYGYGPEGRTGIPVNANLMFDIKLNSITK